MGRTVLPPAMLLDSTPRRALNVTALICVVGGVVALIVAAIVGHAVEGIALAFGLVLGAGNGLLAQRLLAFGVPFVATSLMRLLALTAVAGASGVFLGWRRIVLVVVGMALAQLVLSVVAAREMLRR